MKTRLFIVLTSVLVLLMSCTDETSINQLQKSALSNPQRIAPLSSGYENFVASNPDIFGSNCFYFHSEDELYAMYDSVSELSSQDFEHWALANNLTNKVVRSNIAYDSIIHTIEQDFRCSLDSASLNMMQTLVNAFAKDSNLISSFVDDNITFYKPSKDMSIEVFANQNDIFVVESYVYYCSPYGVMEIDLDSIIGGKNSLNNLKEDINRDSLWSFVRQFGDKPKPYSHNEIGDPIAISKTIKNSDYQVHIVFDPQEIPRMRNYAIRKVKAIIHSYHIINGKGIVHSCRGTLRGSITTYNYYYENVSQGSFNLTNKRMKNKEFLLDRNWHSSCFVAFISLRSFNYQFSNEHELSVSYPQD